MSGEGASMQVAAAAGACRWCSRRFRLVWHDSVCPRVKAIEYHPDGSVKRVEFHDPNEEPVE